METRLLKYFVAVAEEGSFNRASVRLRVAQPALSRAIQTVEGQVGAKLFVRKRSGIHLTPTGEKFMVRANGIIEQVNRLSKDFREATRVYKKSLVVGYVGAGPLHLLTPTLQCFQALHPDVKVKLVRALPEKHIELLRSREIDIAFTHCTKSTTDIEVRDFMPCPIVVALPSAHPLSLRGALRLEELKDEDFVFCPRKSRPAYYDYIIGLCKEVGFEPRIIAEDELMTEMVALVAYGSGISLLPAVVEKFYCSGAVYKPLIEPEASIEFSFAWRKKEPSGLVESFMKVAESQK